MKNNLRSIAAAAGSGLLALAPAVHAADGQIDFSGSVVSSSCTVNGGAPSFTVTLPPVSSKSLSALGKTAGRVPVPITLTGCTPGSKVRAHFEQGPTVKSKGRLAVDAGGAANVDLQLLNESFGPLLAGAAEGGQNTRFVPVSGTGGAELMYYVEYFATHAATPGAVKSRVMYSISYE
ncbi:Major fimbrial subunit SMF-1 [compost metagenome]